MAKRGYIYWVDPGQTRGNETYGKRPYLVLSTNTIPDLFGVAIGIAGTTGGKYAKSEGNVAVVVSAAESGMAKDSVFLCHQIRVLDLTKFSNQAAGAISGETLERIENAVRYCLGLGFTS